PPPNLKEADVILPASHLMERDGTIINLEGRVQRAKSAVKAHITTKPDWWITSKIAQKIKSTDPGYKNASDVFKEIAGSFPAFKGLSSSRLGKGGKHLVRSKIKDTESTFIPFTIKGKSDGAGKSYPYTLMFGWNLLSYRNGAFTETIADMKKVLPENKVEISPEDAKKAGVKNGDTVLLKFPDGLLIHRMVKITSRVKDKILYTWLGRNDIYGRLVKGNVSLVNIEKGTYEQNN
ncbi:MAG: molybdopterin-dependent oxidoreductase, partial [bacterium]